LVFGIPGWRRRKSVTILSLLALLSIVATGLTGCGNKMATVTGNPGTTAGNYVMTVTATSGAITETGTVTLTVQ
jgi:hypothetical protein